MRKFYAILVPLLFAVSMPSSGQSGIVNQSWEFVPKFGHADMAVQAIKDHVAWRVANGDTWEWDVFQVVTGNNMNTLYARSGNHAWADWDSYELAGATAHFNETVMPHLASMSNMITTSDTTNFVWSEDADFSLYQVARYDLIPARQQAFTESLEKFSSAIKKHDPTKYHYFEWINSGGDGQTELQGVFPAENWAGFAETDPSVMKIMVDEYGEEETQEIFQSWISSIRNASSVIVVHRKDLSSSAFK